MISLLSGLITSKTRIKILMRLFLNPKGTAYLRELADDFQASPSQVKEELDQLRKAKLLVSNKEGRHVLFSANHEHPLFSELHSMVKKALGMDEILESIIKRLGRLQQAFLIDDYAEGKDTGIIDLVLIGDIDKTNLMDLTTKTEKYIERKIRTLTMTQEEFEKHGTMLKKHPQFMLWQQKNETGSESLPASTLNS
ncbi:MAG: winged helix-turn-helix domain-containing protein [Desulfobulbus sp.]|nr:winged helix-turn-helix domain-containing protein [Desulfobulbus sp.]